MAISDDLTKRLALATTSIDNGNALADILNGAQALVAQGPVVIAAAIVATNVSQTIDFAALKVGDKVAMIPATAGNADFISPSVAGDLGQAAVVGNLYLVFRASVIPAASAVKF